MDKKGIVIACGLIAVVAVAGGTLKSVLAADEPEVGSAVHTGIAGGYMLSDGAAGAWMQPGVEAIGGIDVGEMANSVMASLQEQENQAADMGDLLANLNDLIDPDKHVDFADLSNLVIDEEMGEALKQTNIYKMYAEEGEAFTWLDKDECLSCFDENLNTLLLAYNSGTITKSDYYQWCNNCVWPDAESLAWKDVYCNMKDRVWVEHGDYTETSAINPTVPGNESLATNPSGVTGSGTVNQGGGNGGGGTSVVQTPEQPSVDPGASTGGYNTPDWQDPAATEDWGAGQPATEESIADFSAQFGATSQTDAGAADSVNRQDTGNEGAVIR